MTKVEKEFNQLVSDNNSPSIGDWNSVLGFLEHNYEHLSRKQINMLCEKSEEFRNYFNTERVEQTTIRKNGSDIDNIVVIKGLGITSDDVNVICNLKKML